MIDLQGQVQMELNGARHAPVLAVETAEHEIEALVLDMPEATPGIASGWSMRWSTRPTTRTCSAGETSLHDRARSPRHDSPAPSEQTGLPLDYAGGAGYLPQQTLHLVDADRRQGEAALAASNPLVGYACSSPARGSPPARMALGNRVLADRFRFAARTCWSCAPATRASSASGLEPMATADFHAARLGGLKRARRSIAHSGPLPVEIEDAISVRSGSPAWRAMTDRRAKPSGPACAGRRVFNIFRARFLGKVEPGAISSGVRFDLAVTRFSGHAAPPLKSNNSPNVAAW